MIKHRGIQTQKKTEIPIQEDKSFLSNSIKKTPKKIGAFFICLIISIIIFKKNTIIYQY